LPEEYEYDFAISFAGQNRDTADNLAKLLTEGDARVFYDLNFQAHLLGKDFQQEWKKICKISKYLIVIVSEYYPVREWTQFEFEVAKKEAQKRETEFILPLLIDSSEVVGLPYTTSHIDLRNRDIKDAAKTLLSKLHDVSKQDDTLRKRDTGDYKKRRDNLIRLIISGEISKFNEIRIEENYDTLDLRQLDIGGNWKLNGKFRPLTFDNISLKKSVLDQSDLSEIRIKNSDLSASTYYLANLSETRFENVNASNCFMQQTDLYGCFMRDCDCSNSNFSIANLFTAYFSRCLIYHANFSYAKCNNSSFDKCLFYDVNLNNSNLSEASFESSLLLNISNFKNINCLKARFTHALINNEEFVLYLRSQGAINVPDAIMDVQEIRRQLIRTSCSQIIIDKILQNLR